MPEWSYGSSSLGRHEERHIVPSVVSRKSPNYAFMYTFSRHPVESSWWRLSSCACLRNALVGAPNFRQLALVDSISDLQASMSKLRRPSVSWLNCVTPSIVVWTPHYKKPLLAQMLKSFPFAIPRERKANWTNIKTIKDVLHAEVYTGEDERQ